MFFAFLPQILGNISEHIIQQHLRGLSACSTWMLLVHFGISVLLPHAFSGKTLLLHVRGCLEKVKEGGEVSIWSKRPLKVVH